MNIKTTMTATVTAMVLLANGPVPAQGDQLQPKDPTAGLGNKTLPRQGTPARRGDGALTREKPDDRTGSTNPGQIANKTVLVKTAAKEAFIAVTKGTEQVLPPSLVKSHPALVTALRARIPSVAVGVAQEDQKYIKQLTAAYTSAGYRVTPFVTLSDYNPIDAAMTVISQNYQKSKRKLDVVALHIVGHGGGGDICLIPVQYKAVTLNSSTGIQKQGLSAKRYDGKGRCRSHSAIGKKIASIFPSSAPPFAATRFLGAFDACCQGVNLKGFASGLKTGGQPGATGYLLTATTGEKSALGEYSAGYAGALTAQAKRDFDADVTIGHNGGVAATRGIQRPQKQRF